MLALGPLPGQLHTCTEMLTGSHDAANHHYTFTSKILLNSFYQYLHLLIFVQNIIFTINPFTPT